LPIFSDIVLASSGIESTERRLQINKLVTEQKGVYVKNIERPVKVTHLLCSGDEDTEKMKYAKKFNERGEADIKLVWEEWFWDCLIFGGTFHSQNIVHLHPLPTRVQADLTRRNTL
jgi:DNA replication regulator DPB11